MTVNEIIEKAGGVSAIASAIKGLGRDAVYKWKGIGIPDRHWPKLINLCQAGAFDLTPQMLFDANQRARSPRKAAA